MFGGSRPNRALTMSATCPAGTMGTVGAIVAVVGGGDGVAGGGSATGCGGDRTSGLLGAAGGANTPEPAPGGIRFWLGPIEPGGRGIESKPGGVDCAKDVPNEPAAMPIASSAAAKWRPDGGRAGRCAVMTPRLPLKIWRIQAVDSRFVTASAAC